MAKAKPEVGKACAQAESEAGGPELPAIDELYLTYLASYCDMLVVERNASQHTVRNYRLDLLDYFRAIPISAEAIISLTSPPKNTEKEPEITA